MAMTLKIFKYEYDSPFSGIIGSSRKLAWPVFAYRITLPRVSNQSRASNPFEAVILKLLEDGGRMDSAMLSEETCIPIDLVQSILARLRDKGLIDDDNIINKNMLSAYFSDLREISMDSVKYCSAMIFRERVAGQLLPFMYILDNNEPERCFEEEGGYRVLHWDKQYNDKTPKPKDVVAIINKLKKRSNIYNRKSLTPAIEQIRILPSAEAYTLECQIAIQKNDADFRIADPFGFGFSRELEKVFEQKLSTDQQLASWMQQWRQNLSNPKRNDMQYNAIEPFNNDVCNQRYPQLINRLRVDRLRSYRTIDNIYAAIEWALFYSSYARAYKSAVSRLRILGGASQPALLEGIAKSIGFETPANSFRPLPDGKIDAFLSGDAEMSTVLAVALLLADDDNAHPLWAIAQSQPDLLLKLRKLGAKRGGYAHGEYKDQATRELPDDAFMRTIVNALLSDVRFSDTKASQESSNQLSDARLDSLTSLLGHLGYGVYNMLDEAAQERFIGAEQFWMSFGSEGDALQFLNDIYAALQATLRTVLTISTSLSLADSEYIAQAENNATHAGMGGFSDVLKTTKPDFIRETIRGNNQTLGSCVVAYLLTSSHETLIDIGERQPTFIKDMEKVIDMRGHGNKSISMRKEDLNRIRKMTYVTIRTLLES